MLHAAPRPTAFLSLLALAFVGAALVAMAAPAHASAIVDNGLIQIGVNDAGDLNAPGGSPSSQTQTTTVGLRYMPTNAESTAPGCPCEGWGVAYDGVTSGGADETFGGLVGSISVVSFTHTATSAVSTTKVGDLQIVQDYHPSAATANLYEDKVTITNQGGAAHNDVTYRRAMDWDIEPTAFNEFVTIVAGTPPPSNLQYSSDNGFTTPDPLTPAGSLLFVGPPSGPDVYDSGPSDHGAVFDFNFGTLAPGQSRVFRVMYGAAGNEADMLAALAAGQAEVYTLGEPNTPDGPTLGTPNTFAFAFSGVGGEPIGGCREHVKYGDAFVGRVGVEDIGNTGNVGPLDVTVEETGPYAGSANLSDVDTFANTSGPLLVAASARSSVAFDPCKAHAMAEVAELDQGPAFPAPPGPIHAIALRAESESACGAQRGSVTIGRLEVNGITIIDTATSPAPNTQQTIGPITVILNEQYQDGSNFTVNAVHIKAPGYADVILSSATTGIDCQPIVVQPQCIDVTAANETLPPCGCKPGQGLLGLVDDPSCPKCVEVHTDGVGTAPTGGTGSGDVYVDCHGPCVGAAIAGISTVECFDPCGGLPILDQLLHTHATSGAGSVIANLLGTASGLPGPPDCLPRCLPQVPTVGALPVHVSGCLPCVNVAAAAVGAAASGCVVCDLTLPACFECVNGVDALAGVAAASCGACDLSPIPPACTVCTNAVAPAGVAARACGMPLCAKAIAAGQVGFVTCPPPDCQGNVGSDVIACPHLLARLPNLQAMGMRRG